ncbi:carbonic anhydrase [Sphingomicrobium sediminis]|uniref:carbonic anhydrase n=1 Tax=Sphingomicrobium sediminis TaxID=2950949 RepID=A0A9X2ELR4_9SPHN|nr:carbonic anhydrase family protein [Sphingomicrobium sediminis]MCM8557762.1 carbonic anhydrase family protein [Sphingomicrobium sediminis]
MMTKLLGAAAACAMIATPALAQEKPGKDWNFGDGVTDERWSLISTEYGMCDAGLMQSPIDLATAKARGNVELDVNFGDAPGTVALGEEKVQVDFAPGYGMNSGGKDFNLIQVHFHTPAEHAIDGERQPLVAHFVHATDEGELGVLGVLYEVGDGNDALDTLVAAVNMGDGTSVTVDTEGMLPDDLDVYRYMGSLTTPPCSEGVNWHVVAEPVEASAEQIAAIRAALGGDTARSIQPTGNRLVVAPE